MIYVTLAIIYAILSGYVSLCTHVLSTKNSLFYSLYNVHIFITSVKYWIRILEMWNYKYCLTLILQNFIHVVTALGSLQTLLWHVKKFVAIDQFHKFQNAPVPYPTMLHSEQKCAHFCSEWSIVGYGTGALPQCSIQNRNVHISVMHCGIWNRCILEFVN